MTFDEPASDVEQAVLGLPTVAAVRALVDGYLARRLGSRIARVRFRSGRIDAVWGVELADGRAVVVKAHRPPVDDDALRVVLDAQRRLAGAGFPAAEPLVGPDPVDGHVLTVETLLPGTVPDGRTEPGRRLLAAGLARHIDLLRADRRLRSQVGPGPSWWRYRDGPWPVSHDPIVDLQRTVPGSEWLDDFAARAAEQLLEARDDRRVVVAHADWYAGNVHAEGGRLTGVFDWDLVADDEAVVAGFAAAGYAAASDTGGMSSPAEAARFLEEYAAIRGRPWTAREARAAAGGAAWTIAFDARFQVSLLALGIGDEAAIDRVRRHGEEYLAPLLTV